MFEEQKQLAAIQSDEIEEAVEEAESDADDDIIRRKTMKVPVALNLSLRRHFIRGHSQKKICAK